MKTPPKKVLFAAVICYVGLFIAHYIAKIPPPEPLTSLEICIGTPWSVWDYLSVVSLTCALGLTIAAFKLRE